MDKARRKTDRILADLERRIARVYSDSPSLRQIEQKYKKYMKSVKEATKDLYKAYKKETDADKKRELKKKYIDAVKRLTIYNRQYLKMMNEYTDVLADLNEQALNISNEAMAEVYVLNYNQLAVDCRKVGIKVAEQ